MTTAPHHASRLHLACAALLIGFSPCPGALGSDPQNGVNLQPTHWNGGDVTIDWAMMRGEPRIRIVRILIEPSAPIGRVKTWVAQAAANGYSLICAYQSASGQGTNSVAELMAAAKWWRDNYRELSAAGPFRINLMNEWGDHSITPADYAGAYNAAIAVVRSVYAGNIIIDLPGWGQETHTAALAVAGANGARIVDANITLSVHIYPGDWNQALNHWLQESDLDELGGAGRACIVGEFGSDSKSSAWSALVDHAKAKGWSVLAWAWNGDGGAMNMVAPSWALQPKASSFSKSSYFDVVYPKL